MFASYFKGYVNFGQKPCNSRLPVKPRSRIPEQADLLHPRRPDMIDARYELVKLAALIDWDFFGQQGTGFFPTHQARPATSPRLVAGL